MLSVFASNNGFTIIPTAIKRLLLCSLNNFGSICNNSLSMSFFCPFSILITLFEEEGAGLCAYRALFVSYAHVNLCHFFSSSWYRGLAAASACGSSWTFLFTFLGALGA